MPPMDASDMKNYYPDLEGVRPRYGYASAFTSVGSTDVQSMFAFEYEGGQKLVACTTDEIYWVDDTTPTSLKGSLNNGYWYGTVFADRLFIGNGADTAQAYTGSAIADVAFTGPTTNNLIGFQSFKSRLYTWEDGKSSFWYGAVNAIAGVFTEFDLAGVTKLGGTLTHMDTLTLDGGNGVDDLAVFIFNTGEVAIYQGSNPGDSTDWALVGVYRIGRPLGRRCAERIAGDLMVLTEEDYVSLSQAVRGQVPQSKISGASRAAASTYKGNIGWQPVHYPEGQILIVNVPTGASTSIQHAMNTKTGAWTRYEDITSFCWCRYNSNLYFGGAGGVVYQGETGTSDAGTAINAEFTSAAAALGIPGNKVFKTVRPIIKTVGSLNYSLGFSYDLKDVSVTTSATTTSAGTAWGSPWGSPWTDYNTVHDQWSGASGRGYTVSEVFGTVTSGFTPVLYRFDYMVELSPAL
jgi:hypothetical protein